MRNSHHPALAVEINMGSDSYKEWGLESTEEMGGIHNYQLYSKNVHWANTEGSVLGGTEPFYFF